LHVQLAMPHEGVNIVGVQYGTLTHHYWTDRNVIIQKVNIIERPANNQVAIWMSIIKAAQNLIKKGEEITDRILNMIEMVVGVYDPCFSCAIQCLPVPSSAFQCICR
jgi:coenzyme F420-reducing hydrogenase alpha subunit